MQGVAQRSHLRRSTQSNKEVVVAVISGSSRTLDLDATADAPAQTQEISEQLTRGPAQGFAAMLNDDDVDLSDGAALPHGWHWFYLLDRAPQRDLGQDGHRARGFPEPPGPNLRRMWAGGEIEFRRPLRIGEQLMRRSVVVSAVEKHGRSGPMTVVSIRHDIIQQGDVAVRERQDLIYRAQPRSTNGGPSAAGRSAPHESVPPADDEWRLDTDATFLFRFSALTFNGHRIHYDRDYARNIEGYPGLLVHGPLQAVAMLEAARRRGLLAPIEAMRYQYRLVSPLFDGQGLVVAAECTTDLCGLHCRDDTGRVTAQGSVRRL